MLDLVDFAAEPLTGKHLLELRGYIRALLSVSHAIHEQPQIGPRGQSELNLPPEVRLRVLVDSDMIHFVEGNAGIAQTVADRFRGKPCPMFDPAEAFFFSGGNEYAVPHETGGGVAVIRIDA